ncbi:MAG: helix-turn-helix domain-containing protein [Gordonia amarae]
MAEKTEGAHALLTPAEVADRLRVTTKALAYWRATNTGPVSVKVGGSVRYPREQFEAWIAREMSQSERGERVSA